MSAIAKLFTTGGSQAVRLPAAFRFQGAEVLIRRNAKTGEVILSPKPVRYAWTDFFALADETDIPEDFMQVRDDAPDEERGLF